MSLRVKILAFARARELLGAPERMLVVPQASCVADAWTRLRAELPAFGELDSSLRLALNGKLARPSDPLADGDELALLPPVGGG